MRISKGHWENLSFTKKIKGYFILSLLVLLGIFYSIYKSNKSFIDTAESVEHTTNVLLQNQKILNNSLGLSISTTKYLISGKAENLKSFQKLSLLILRDVDDFKKLTADNASQQARIVVMDTLIKKYIVFGKKLIDLRNKNGFIATNSLFIKNFGNNFIEELKAVTEQIDKQERRLLNIRKNNNEITIKNSSGLIVVLELLIILLLIFGFNIIYNNTTKRNKAELELKRSNYFITSIIENSHNPISIRDLSGKYILANKPFAEKFDFTEKNITEQSFYNLYPKEVKDLIEKTDTEILTTKTTVTIEYKLSLRDGAHHYSSACFPLFNESNNIYALGSILTDITSIRKRKEELIKNNNILQTLLNGLQQLMDTSSNVICIIDEDGRFSHVSLACEKLWGFSATELTGKKYEELVYEEDREKTNIAAANLMSGIQYNDFENRCYTKDGKGVSVIWVGIWREEEKLYYFIANDATEKKKTLKQLKESEASLANAQKIARLGNWEIDIRKGTVSGSDEFYAITGKTREEFGNTVKQFYKVLHPVDRAALTEDFKKAMHEKNPLDVEYRIQSESTVTNVHVKAEIIFAKDGEPVKFKGTIQDITNSKKLEQEREVVIQELIKSNADLKQFSFITSHNFRAPLSNIISILNLFDDKYLDENNKELLEMLKTCSLQLNKTIEDLTSILLIKNNVNDCVDTISFLAIYDKVQKVFSNALIDAAGYIVTDFKVPFVKFNAVYLESILINLVSNAINYRSQHRSLKIHISSSIDKNKHIRLVVSDNGKGIDLARHGNKIFGLYQRFHENTNGHGLGLFIIKSQINALGGIIEVESQVDKGTTFIITFKDILLSNVHSATDDKKCEEHKVVKAAAVI